MQIEQLNSKSTVAEMIESYGLPKSLMVKLTLIAEAQIKRFSLNSFDEKYRYIGELVAKFTKPLQEKMSLDAPFSQGTTDSLYDLLGEDNNLLTKVFNTEDMENAHQNGILLGDAISILKDQLGNRELFLLERLLTDETKEMRLRLNLNDVSGELNELRLKLEEIADKFEVNGRLVVPRRSIVYIGFNPLKIKYKIRRFHGDPLSYYLEHKDIYEGLGRGALSVADNGLLKALKYCGQIDKAIPKIRDDYGSKTEEEIDEMVDTFKIIGSVQGTAKKLKYSQSTVNKYLKKRGFEITRGPKSGRLTPLQKQEVISSYPLYEGNPTEAARNLPYSRHKIDKAWREKDLEIKKQGHALPSVKRLSQAQKKNICDAFFAFDGDANKASNKLRHGRKTFIRYWTKAGYIDE